MGQRRAQPADHRGDPRRQLSSATSGRPVERLRRIEDNLVVLVLATAVLGVVIPATGRALTGAITPLLALLMLSVSLTFDVQTLRDVLRRPGVVAISTLLVYGPMSLIALGLAWWAFGDGPLWLGVVLLGVLPTDVSSPLLVWIGRGNVALATVANAVNTALAPIVVPALFLAYTGVDLEVPMVALAAELALVVVVPTVVGVTVRSQWAAQLERAEPALSATGSLSYLALLLAVVAANRDLIVGAPRSLLVVVLVAVALNIAGYLVAAAAGPLIDRSRDRVAMLFTVSKKEFSIAAFVVASAGLPPEVALPAVVYAIVQMVSSPLVARAAARRG